MQYIQMQKYDFNKVAKHKEVWKKKFNLIFISIQLSEMHETRRVHWYGQRKSDDFLVMEYKYTKFKSKLLVNVILDLDWNKQNLNRIYPLLFSQKAS